MTDSENSPYQPARHRSRRSLWRRYVLCWGQEYQWSIIGVLGILAVVLGYMGFQKYMTALGEKRTVLDIVYLTLQLFTFESGSVPGKLPWQLQIARLLAPGVLAFTAVKALVVIFREQIQLFRIRFLKNHIVVCGLGRKGFLLVKAFREQGYHVVGIEFDTVSSLADQCRGQGAIILSGDAADRVLLRKARIDNAGYLFSVCGDDGANAEVAVQTRELVKDLTGHGLTCFIHISDLELAGLLREKEVTSQKADAFRLEFFNVYDRAAQILLSEFPAFDEERHAHVVIVGLSRTGKSLLIRIAKSWHAIRTKSGDRLGITVVDIEAEAKVNILCQRYPQLARVCNIDVQQMDVQTPEFQKAEFLTGKQNQEDITAAYVCLGEDVKGLTSALIVRQHLKGRQVPVIVTMKHEAGLATLLRGEDGTGQNFDNLHGFGLLDKACSPDLLFGATNENIARASHKYYVRSEEKKGQTPQTNSSIVPWSELSEDLRDSNRRQADHIGTKLRAIDCDIAPLYDWDTKLIEFSPKEIEDLAIMEHKRWVKEKRDAEWVDGPLDRDKKIHPDLVSWEDLTDEAKEKDRNVARHLPTLLAMAGFDIQRNNINN